MHSHLPPISGRLEALALPDGSRIQTVRIAARILFSSSSDICVT